MHPLTDDGGSSMKTLTRLLAVLFAVVLVASACGDDDDATTADEGTDTTEATAADDEGAEDQPADDGGDGEADESMDDEAAAGFVPGSPECVAPADAGGGWDFTCRSIGQLFEDLGLTENVVVTNQPGGGGGVAFSDIAANRNDNSDLVIAASPATAIRFAQNQYEGLTADQFPVDRSDRRRLRRGRRDRRG